MHLHTGSLTNQWIHEDGDWTLSLSTSLTVYLEHSKYLTNTAHLKIPRETAVNIFMNIFFCDQQLSCWD